MRGKRLFGCLTAFLSCMACGGAAWSEPEISYDLKAKLADSSDETVTVILELAGSASLTKSKGFLDDRLNRKGKIGRLKEEFRKSKSSFSEYLNKSAAAGKSDFEVTYLWLSNAVVLKSKESLVKRAISYKDVLNAHLDRIITIPPISFPDEPGLATDYDENGNVNQYTYGLKMIGIEHLAQYYPDIDGNGVVVGHIDTGVNAEHPDLKGKVLAFKDFVNGRKEAYDDNNHGTHTAGTIVGESASGTRIGVAPGAKLVVAKVFDSQGSAEESKILKAMEWIVDPDGNSSTKSDDPEVISNSWGGMAGSMEQEGPFFNAVKGWVLLGIFPCFAAGNDGPGPGTISTPGGYAHSFAVGATDENDAITSFSSRGPFTFDGKVYNKPDISAPGNRVFSSLANGSWGKLSGTSMATPHVAGVVALLYQVDPKMTVERAIRILDYSAVDIDAQGYDFNSGWGRINLLKALEPFLDNQLEIPLARNN